MSLPDYVIRSFERSAHPYHMWDGIQAIPDTLSYVLAEYKQNGFRDAATLLKDKKRINLTGCGTSLYNAMAGARFFETLTGISASAHQSWEFEHYYNLPLSEDALIGISHTGSTAVAVASVKKAAESGAATIAVTDVPDSPLAAAAAAVLPGCAGREWSLPKTRSYIAAAFRLFLLAIAAGEKRAGEYTGLIEELPGGAARVLSETAELAKMAASACYSKIYLFGCGVNWATVSEAALKLQEAAQTLSFPYQLEEGMHGPWVTMNKGDLVVVLAMKGPGYEKSLKLVEALRHIGVDIYMITNDADNNTDVTYKTLLPDVPELMTVFYTILPLYQFVYYTAVAKGLSPDCMRLRDEAYLATRLSLPR